MIKLFVAIMLIGLAGCGSLKIMHECAKVSDRQEYVCKSLGFWE